MESIESLSERLEVLENQTHAVKRRLHCWRGIACGVVVLSLLGWALPSGEAQEELSARGNRSLERRIEALEYKLAHITSGPDDVTITGANLRIVNGLGTTNTTNGLGNLIVGYNELRGSEPNVRTGSHNVVVGSSDNFSSFGGLVVGAFNEISGEFASVSGGVGNTASGRSSSVSGGATNTASNNESWVGGGNGNTASGAISVVSGGHVNTASGDFSSVSGGFGNTASGDNSSVSGGNTRTAPGQFNWAAGPLFADN
jgi:hypothetical protein